MIIPRITVFHLCHKMDQAGRDPVPDEPRQRHPGTAAHGGADAEDRSGAHALRQELGEEPTAAQIAEKCGLPEEKVAELTQLTPDICSLDVPTGDDDGTALQSLLEDAQAPQPYEEVVRGELDKTMDQLLSTLNERQQQILRLHFGMEDGNCYSLEEIGKKLSISKERVRQIERQAMDKLQKMGTSLGLEDFLNE